MNKYFTVEIFWGV